TRCGADERVISCKTAEYHRRPRPYHLSATRPFPERYRPFRSWPTSCPWRESRFGCPAVRPHIQLNPFDGGFMRTRLSARVRIVCAAGAAIIVSAASASAQTTVNLPAVTHGTVRAGSYANKKQGDLLATRASTNPEYLRRTILKFDTQGGVPAGANV